MTRHRGECVCGWRGRWFVDYGDANAAAHSHISRVETSQASSKFREGEFATVSFHRSQVASVGDTGYF